MSHKEKLLIVEDDPEISRQLKWAFADEYEVHLAQDSQSGLEILNKKKPPVVTLDLGLPPRPHDSQVGMALLGNILQREPHCKVIVVTGQNERENALQAISFGAWDYYHKPIDVDELRMIIKRAFHVSSLEKESLEREHSLEESGRLDELIGSSPEISEIFSKIRKVASADVSVLILGESGTGKELIARSIHNHSSRREKPFFALNCGAIPEALLEAELFGHEKGAFTGAHVMRKGKVEYADGGTLFLDEVGELPPVLQVKILRFLQERTFERIGGRESLKVDVRIIAATQKNLEEAISKGEFREDTYYRLSVVRVAVPPLRDRASDILLLANYFRKKSCEEMKKPPARFDLSAVQALMEYKWPGNVREVENRVKRAVVMSEGALIKAEDLELPLACNGVKGEETLKQAREKLEREFISSALASNNWNIARTAEQIGVARPTLYDLMKKYNLQVKDVSS
jgi:two-component system NtrC family response regulator